MQRPDLVHAAADHLRPLERLQLAAVRKTFEAKRLGGALQWLQHGVGTRWIRFATNNLHHVHHLDRLPVPKPGDSYILVCNHRSFFDLFVVIPQLMRHGLTQRIVFPVRSNFFYDSPLGFAVNGAMSFFAMYPPIFRDRQRATLNRLGLEELIWLLRQGGYLVGFHPEGTRNKDDPYRLLPARTGVGTLIRHARVPVIPVFTNGLHPDDLKRQLLSNFDATGTPIHTVFGEPIDFGALLDLEPSQSTYKRIANRTREVLLQLAGEERELRAKHAASNGG